MGCAFCAYGKFSYSVTAYPATSALPISSPSECTLALKDLNDTIASTHKIQQHFNALRPRILNLVNAIGAYKHASSYDTATNCEIMPSGSKSLNPIASMDDPLTATVEATVGMTIDLPEWF